MPAVHVVPVPTTILLDTPTFSIGSGSYPITDFNLPLSLQNPNPPGSSDLYYQIDYGAWQLYTGTIHVAPGAVVAAQAVPRSDLYRSSRRVDESYAVLPAGLLPPAIVPSRPEFGLFVGREVAITLVNPNLSSISRVEYRVGGGTWQAYAGTFVLDRDHHLSGALVEARAVPTDPHYLASVETLRTLGIETPYIAGVSAGSFSDPTGQEEMLTNLAPGGSSDHFAWGRDYLLKGERLDAESLANLKQSSLDFQGSSFSGVEVGRSFEIGSLSYFNGSIVDKTAATAVSFAADLALTLNGIAVSASFHFDFDLVNVINENDPANPWADADYVRLATPTSSDLLDFNGIHYRLQLEFGDSTPSGIALFDEFHVLEGRSATTRLYGTLVEVGTVSFSGP